jgi:hypothetical protein
MSDIAEQTARQNLSKRKFLFSRSEAKDISDIEYSIIEESDDGVQ